MKIIIIITIKSFQKIFQINNIKILYYNRIDVSVDIDASKTSA